MYDMLSHKKDIGLISPVRKSVWMILAMFFFSSLFTVLCTYIFSVIFFLSFS
jgi:hypothetical protein